MAKIFIKHVDEVPWGPRHRTMEDGGTASSHGKFIGDPADGPWVNYSEMGPAFLVKPHSHPVDEVIFVVKGGLKLGAKTYGPGTIVSIKADTQYQLQAGPEGCTFVNVRAGDPKKASFASGSGPKLAPQG